MKKWKMSPRSVIRVTPRSPRLLEGLEEGAFVAGTAPDVTIREDGARRHGAKITRNPNRERTGPPTGRRFP